MAWLLTTPSSRGIGFALTRHLLTHTPPSMPIVATARSDLAGVRERLLSDLPSPTSSSITQAHKDRLDVQHCDLLQESSIAELAGYCKERYQRSDSKGNDKGKGNTAPHLRLAFMTPGQLIPEKAPEKIEYDSALDTLKFNLLSNMMLAKHFVPFLPKKSQTLEDVEGLPAAATLAYMSARVGSIGDNGLGGWYSYRCSKAGVNQLVKSVDLYLKTKSGGNARCVGLHPGTVKTELSREFWGGVKEGKLFSAEFAAGRLWEVVVKEVGEEGRGRCWDWEGKEVPP